MIVPSRSSRTPDLTGRPPFWKLPLHCRRWPRRAAAPEGLPPPSWRLRSCRRGARGTEGAPLVLPVGRRAPLVRARQARGVVEHECPGPHVGVVVPPVLLVEGDRLGDQVAFVRRPLRRGAVVGQDRHPGTPSVAASDDLGIDGEPVL